MLIVYEIAILYFLAGCQAPSATQVSAPTQLLASIHQQTIPEATQDVSSDTTLTLQQAEQVIFHSMMSDARLRSAMYSVEIAQADYMTSSSIPNPKLNLVQTLLPLNKAFTPDRQGGPPQFDAYLDIPMDWLLFGKRLATQAVAQGGISIAEAEYQELLRLRMSESVQLFWDAAEAHTRCQLVQQELNMLNALIEKRSIQQDECKDIKRELEKELRNVKLVSTQCCSKLATRLGVKHCSVVIPLQINHLMTVNVEDVLQQAVKNRPDIAAGQRKVAQAAMQVDLEDRKAMPELVPQFVYTRQFQEKALGFPDANSWGFGVTCALPIYDRNQGNRQKARAQHQQASWNGHAQQRELQAEVEQVVAEYQAASQSWIEFSETDYNNARIQWMELHQRCLLNTGTFSEWERARKLYHELAMELITIQATYWKSTWKLHYCIGSHLFNQ